MDQLNLTKRLSLCSSQNYENHEVFSWLNKLFKGKISHNKFKVFQTSMMKQALLGTLQPLTNLRKLNRVQDAFKPGMPRNSIQESAIFALCVPMLVPDSMIKNSKDRSVDCLTVDTVSSDLDKYYLFEMNLYFRKVKGLNLIIVRITKQSVSL